MTYSAGPLSGLSRRSPAGLYPCGWYIQYKRMSDIVLNILGSASAKPTALRNPSAQVLDVRGRLFLIDCGEGAQIQMVRMGISPLKIEAVCLSHLHGDHVFGIFGLLSTMGMLGRVRPLKIFAPEGFGDVLEFYLAHFSDGDSYRIEFTPVDVAGPEKILDAGGIEIRAFPLKHRVPTFGYLFKEKEKELNVRKEAIAKYDLTIDEIKALKAGRDVVRPIGTVISVAEATYRPAPPKSFAYCSDTAPFPELAQWVNGVDLLYHEATFPKDMADLAAVTNHSTTVDAARCALDAGARRLVVGHYSSRFSDVEFFLDEIRAVFPASFLASDGDVFEI